jgi:hypothetical protein
MSPEDASQRRHPLPTIFSPAACPNQDLPENSPGRDDHHIRLGSGKTSRVEERAWTIDGQNPVALRRFFYGDTGSGYSQKAIVCGKQQHEIGKKGRAQDPVRASVLLCQPEARDGIGGVFLKRHPAQSQQWPAPSHEGDSMKRIWTWLIIEHLDSKHWLSLKDPR